MKPIPKFANFSPGCKDCPKQCPTFRTELGLVPYLVGDEKGEPIAPVTVRPIREPNILRKFFRHIFESTSSKTLGSMAVSLGMCDGPDGPNCRVPTAVDELTADLETLAVVTELSTFLLRVEDIPLSESP